MKWWLAALLFGCGGPVGSRASAITNGTPESGDPGVAALLRAGSLVCTATLIAPRVLLTAAHCLMGSDSPRAYFGDAPTAGSTLVELIDRRLHPSFDAATLQGDVALALLAAPSSALPYPLPPRALTSSDVGAALRLVGFGLTDPNDSSPPQKREGRTVLASLLAEQLTFAPSPAQTCGGDSGGPAFAIVDGLEAVVGVTSSGDPACAILATDTRTDAFVASFIAPYLAATAEGAARAGDRCWYAENCAEGECTPALDDPTRWFCSPPCKSGCPAGLSCLADSAGTKLCRHAPPSPGELGAACQSADECVDGLCASSVCARTCFPNLPGFCPDGFECRAFESQHACFVRSSGGCSAVGGSTGSWLLLLVLAIAIRYSGSLR